MNNKTERVFLHLSPMSSQPTSSQIDPSTLIKAKLKAGLAALKQEDYDGAIAHLRQVPRGAYWEQAQMALIVAYDRIENFEKAIALCYPLHSSAKPETQAWAKKSLKKLKWRAKQQEMETAEAPTQAFEAPPEPSQPISDLSVRNPSWRPLSPLRTERWVWLAWSGVLIWGLSQLSGLGFWPAWLSDYQRWVVAVLGVILFAILWIGHQSLAKQLGPLKLRLVELLTVGFTLWAIPFSLDWITTALDRGLARLPWISSFVSIPDWTPLQEPLRWAAVALLVGLPWAIAGILRFYSPGQDFPLEDLKPHSADAMALLERFFKKQRSLSPERLLLLETSVPIIFSVGHSPRDGRIVLSRGLLERLNSEAIAALIAGELGKFATHSALVLPWLNGLLQLPYGLYWLCAGVGNRCREKLVSNHKLDAGFRFLFRTGMVLGGVFGAIAYGLYKLWRWPLLGLSRWRVLYGDRAAADFLGDPAAYSRALRSYAQALCEALAQQEQTLPLLEGFELLLPLGASVALTAALPIVDLEADARLAWDCSSPYRRWLNLNNAHPLLGDRLSLLNGYGIRSKQPPDVMLPAPERDSLNLWVAWTSEKGWGDRRVALRRCFELWGPLLLQGAPFYGAIAGLLMGLLLWGIGATVSLFGLWQLDWMFGDRTLIWGCIPIGVGLGLILRTNSFFPQRAQRETAADRAIATILPQPFLLPMDAEPVQLTGRLTGRAGVSNWLGQDLLLQTEAGPVRLHWCSPLGPAGNLWPKFLRPSFLLGREVVVSGWLRRGATLWLDVEQLRTTSGGRSSERGHPIWAAVMAAIAVLWGILILARV